MVDLVKTFQQILDRARKPAGIRCGRRQRDGVADDRLRAPPLVAGRPPIRLKHMLRNMNSRAALVCAFLAILELIRLQAVLARQDAVFGEIVLKKHTGFDQLMAESAPVKDDWR